MQTRSLLAAAAAVTLGFLAVGVPVAHARTENSVLVARYGFDTGRTSAIMNESGRPGTMTLRTAGGGRLTPVVHGNGRALQFPAKCSGAGCPKAVLQTPSRADLNPGTKPLAFGATIRLARNQTSAGQNVVQKGYSAGNSQYKLQVDGSAGRPSCVLVDVKRSAIHLIKSSGSVADGAWHDVSCRRAGTVFTLIVDGRIRATGRVPSTLSISNNHPLSIGGKGAYRDNDQFHGAVDDIFVMVG